MNMVSEEHQSRPSGGCRDYSYQSAHAETDRKQRTNRMIRQISIRHRDSVSSEIKFAKKIVNHRAFAREPHLAGDHLAEVN